ncbi:MAG: FAD-dependent oxidoreductase [Beijerinckiaceae bacterium]
MTTAGVAAPTVFSRRSLLVAGATLPLARAAHGQAFDTDVVIVGAGAAGLAAAHELRTLQRDFLLLESRERVGGRLYTETSLGAPYDAGALYIHFAERNPWSLVARDLAVETIPDAPRGSFRNFIDGVEVPREAAGARRQKFAQLSALLDGDDVADVSIAQVAADSGADLGEAADGLSRFAIGDEPQRISARDYARLWSGGDLLLPGGYGILAQKYGADLPIRKNVRVEAIDWSGQGVSVATSAGTIRARSIIVTVSVGVLKAGGIRFTPDLPETIQAALDGLQMGALSKVGLSFDFSKFDVPPGDIFTREAGGGAFNFDCKPFGRDIVVAVFGGDFARTIARSDEDAVNVALDSFVRCAGSSARTAFRGGKVHAWFRDPNALGCYSHCLPGRADAREKLAAPVADRIFFAGEATGLTGGAMTAGGAALAGQAAAKAAVAAPPQPRR